MVLSRSVWGGNRVSSILTSRTTFKRILNEKVK